MTTTPTRRTVLRTASWSMPAVALASAAPAFAASTAGALTITPLSGSITAAACTTSPDSAARFVVHFKGDAVPNPVITLGLSDGFRFLNSSPTYSYQPSTSGLGAGIPPIRFPSNTPRGTVTINATHVDGGVTYRTSTSLNLEASSSGVTLHSRDGVTALPNVELPAGFTALGGTLLLGADGKLHDNGVPIATSRPVKHAFWSRSDFIHPGNGNWTSNDHLVVIPVDGDSFHLSTNWGELENTERPTAPAGATVLAEDMWIEAGALSHRNHLGVVEVLATGVTSAALHRRRVSTSSEHLLTYVAQNSQSGALTGHRRRMLSYSTHTNSGGTWSTPTTRVLGAGSIALGHDYFLTGTTLHLPGGGTRPGVNSAYVSHAGRLTTVEGTLLRATTILGVATRQSTVAAGAVVIGDLTARHPDGRLWAATDVTPASTSSVTMSLVASGTTTAAAVDLPFSLTGSHLARVQYTTPAC